MDVQPPPSDAATLTDPDRRLVERAREATETVFDPDHFDGAHMVGAAVRTTDDEVFTGVSQPAGVGRASVCAEPLPLFYFVGCPRAPEARCGHPPRKNLD